VTVLSGTVIAAAHTSPQNGSRDGLAQPHILGRAHAHLVDTALEGQPMAEYLNGARVLVSGHASRTSSNSGGMSGDAWSAGAPWARRIPSHTATTRAVPVGPGSPRIRTAKRMADRRLAIVPTLAPTPARNTS
jgi:hypothetical protein